VCHEVTGYYEHVKEKYHVQYHIDRGVIKEKLEVISKRLQIPRLKNFAKTETSTIGVIL
jgi:hypothetical protein